MLFATLIALLLARMGKYMRSALLVGLVWVWATPVTVAIAVWQWMVDFEFGVLNWTLTKLAHRRPRPLQLVRQPAGPASR